MAQVRRLLALSDSADKPCGDIDLLVREQIADLAALREEMSQMLSGCHGERIGDCGIVASLGRRQGGLGSGFEWERGKGLFA